MDKYNRKPEYADIEKKLPPLSSMALTWKRSGEKQGNLELEPAVSKKSIFDAIRLTIQPPASTEQVALIIGT